MSISYEAARDFLYREARFIDDKDWDSWLALYAEENHRVVRFHPEARRAYLAFAQSPEAAWCGNFRDLTASVTRLCTLAEGGRVGTALVEAELQRLRWLWQMNRSDADTPETGADEDLLSVLAPERLQAMDLFDRLQLAAVLRVCRSARTLSEAGRTLFHQSRTQRSVVNDADRLRKYLHKHGLRWDEVAARGA